MQEGVILKVCCVLDVCYACYVFFIKTLGKKELVTMNN